MCGIAGYLIADGDLGYMNTERMTAVLATLMQARGSHATGVATVSPKQRVEVRKEPTAADVFLAGRKGIGRSAQTALIHTRHATQGSPSVAGNNHPIVYDSIIGIHNGMVRNDDEVFAHHSWPRKAEVDSEAIFAAIHHADDLTAGLEQIDASWAIAWINQELDPRTLWLARGYQSPLHYARTRLGSLVFASTPEAVRTAMAAGGVIMNDTDRKLHIEEAKPGFLACVDTEGKMDIFPEFDGSGKKAIEREKVTTYSHYGYSGGEDWETGDWRTTSRPKAANAASAGVPQRNATALPDGSRVQRHVVGEGFIWHVSKGGVWVKESDVKPTTDKPDAADPPTTTTERVVQPDVAFARSKIGAAGAHARVKIGSVIEMEVKCSISSPNVITMHGIVVDIDEDLPVVEWSTCRLPSGTQYIVTGQMAETGV